MLFFYINSFAENWQQCLSTFYCSEYFNISLLFLLINANKCRHFTAETKKKFEIVRGHYAKRLTTN